LYTIQIKKMDTRFANLTSEEMLWLLAYRSHELDGALMDMFCALVDMCSAPTEMQYARLRLQNARTRVESAREDIALLPVLADQQAQEEEFDQAIDAEPDTMLPKQTSIAVRTRRAVPVRRWNRTQPQALLERRQRKRTQRLRDSNRKHRL
jgi:hypothetical protein